MDYVSSLVKRLGLVPRTIWSLMASPGRVVLSRRVEPAVRVGPVMKFQVVGLVVDLGAVVHSPVMEAA